MENEKQFSTLLDAGFQVVVKNEGHHWIITKGELRADYWPSREKFRMNLKKGLDRGFDVLVKKLRSAET